MVLIDQQQLTPAMPILSLQQYQAQTRVEGESLIVQLPEGTTIPVQVRINSPVLTADTHGTLVLKLSQPLEVVMQDGKLTGQYRVADGLWNNRRDRYAIRSVQIGSSLTPAQGPQVDVRFDIQTAH